VDMITKCPSISFAEIGGF